MQVTYDGAHSVLIGDFVNGEFDESGFIDTWKDWHLIPTSMPIITPPEVKTSYVEVPGANGAIDMTDLLVGYPLYGSRTGSLTFYVDHNAENWNWDTSYDAILNSLHGFKNKIILKDSPSFYYEGRISINDYKSNKMCCEITLDYELNPFKRMLWTTDGDWLWNPFDFINGIIPVQQQGYFVIPFLSSGYHTDWFTIDNTITGIEPQLARLHIQVLGAIAEDADFVVFEYQTNETGSDIIQVRVSDMTRTTPFDPDVPSTFYEYDTGILVGSPLKNSFIRYRYINDFIDYEGNEVGAAYGFSFRPGRL